MVAETTTNETSEAVGDAVYDGGAIYMAVRQRHHALQDRVRKLMQRETKLEESIAAAEPRLRQLKSTIEQVLKIPANADDMQKMARNTEATLAANRASLASIREELAFVREAMKHADMAHEALHWGCFADQTLARFDRIKAEAVDQTAA